MNLGKSKVDSILTCPCLIPMSQLGARLEGRPRSQCWGRRTDWTRGESEPSVALPLPPPEDLTGKELEEKMGRISYQIGDISRETGIIKGNHVEILDLKSRVNKT